MLAVPIVNEHAISLQHLARKALYFCAGPQPLFLLAALLAQEAFDILVHVPDAHASDTPDLDAWDHPFALQ